MSMTSHFNDDHDHDREPASRCVQWPGSGESACSSATGWRRQSSTSCSRRTGRVAQHGSTAGPSRCTDPSHNLRRLASVPAPQAPSTRQASSSTWFGGGAGRGDGGGDGGRGWGALEGSDRVWLAGVRERPGRTAGEAQSWHTDGRDMACHAIHLGPHTRTAPQTLMHRLGGGRAGD